MINITIPMEPVGKARPRTVRTKGGKSVTFTPDKTAAAENLIRDRVMGLGVKIPSGVPLRVEATFYRSRPKSCKKLMLPVSKPDLDNYAKLLTDALEKFIYENDSQISTLVVKKRFAIKYPCIDLRIVEDTLDVPPDLDLLTAKPLV
jgi:Holliday junction resolvase RusA-like endonuclease